MIASLIESWFLLLGSETNSRVGIVNKAHQTATVTNEILTAVVASVIPNQSG